MKTKVCVGHVKGKRKTKISWYEKIDKRFAIKHGVSRFNSDLMDDRHKPCIKCAGTIRITNSMKCAICQCKDGKFALIPIKTRDKDVRAYSDNVSKKGARREYAREWARKNKDIVILRNMIHRLIDNWKGTGEQAEALLGYTAKDLKSHLEAKFEEGMHWNNHTMKGWHIDHIKPVSKFIKEGITCPKIINGLDNLQPLWANENLRKGSKFQL